MKKKRRMCIMHGLFEVSGQNRYSVLGLNMLGEKSETVVFEKDITGIECDRCLNVNISRRAAFLVYFRKLVFFLFESLIRYDVFHFHFGISVLNNKELWLYKLFKKKVFVEYHGSDIRDYRKARDVYGIPYEDVPELTKRVVKRNKKACRKADGIILHDDELLAHLPDRRAAVYVVPLRYRIDNIEPVFPVAENEHVLRIVHAPTKRNIKGTSYVIEAVEELKEVYNNIELVLVEGKPLQEAFDIFKSADIIVDQLCAGTYGVFAIEAMALGKPVISFISNEMKNRLPDDLPIVSAWKDNIKEKIEMLIVDADLRRKIGIRGRNYVEDYHDYRAIAYILRSIYNGNGKPMRGKAAFEQVKSIKRSIGSNDRN